jgi:ATP-dependent DNA ligase
VLRAACRVGSGMSDLDRQKMREKLQPVLIEGGPGAKAPPCYRCAWV